MGTPNFARSCLASSTTRAPCARAAVPGAQIQIGGDAVCPDTLSRESQACDPSICLQHVQHSTAQAHRHISDIPEAALTTRSHVHNFSPQLCSCALANASATRIVECGCNRDHMYWWRLEAPHRRAAPRRPAPLSSAPGCRTAAFRRSAGRCSERATWPAAPAQQRRGSINKGNNKSCGDSEMVAG